METMSLRRSSRRSSGGGGDRGHESGGASCSSSVVRGNRESFIVGDGCDGTESRVTKRLFGRAAECDGDAAVVEGESHRGPAAAASAGMHGDIRSMDDDHPSRGARPRRLFVGDSVEFVPDYTISTNSRTVASQMIDSAIRDVEAAAGFGLAPPPDSSVRTEASTTSTADSVISSSTATSSSSSDEGGSEGGEEERRGPLFKKKLRITLSVPRTEESAESTLAPSKDHSSNSNEANANDESGRVDDGGLDSREDGDDRAFTIQRLLSLRNERSIAAQAGMTLAQLKQRARQIARDRKPEKKERPKRKKKKSKFHGGRRRRQKPKQQPAATTSGGEGSEEGPLAEPLDKIEMNTGTLYLYRGENPRAKFVRSKY